MDNARHAGSSPARRSVLTRAGTAGLFAGVAAIGRARWSERSGQRAGCGGPRAQAPGAASRSDNFADVMSRHGQTLEPRPGGVTSVLAAESVTDLVLAPGRFPGQIAWVINAGGGSLTFGPAAVSNVADGTSDSIAALTARGFVWHDAASRWYRLS